MRAKTLVLGIALALMLAQDALAAGTNADARFKAIYTNEWAWRQEQYAARDESDKRQPIVDRLVGAGHRAAWHRQGQPDRQFE